MAKSELYLKTMFCCMACDGNIAQEEINLVRNVAMQTTTFEGIDVEKTLNTYVSEINQKGALFLKKYLDELHADKLTSDEEMQIINLALKMIEADNRIEYSEVKFFKKIRFKLSVSDEQILSQHPDKEDFLLPDINVLEAPIWDNNISFTHIQLN